MLMSEIVDQVSFSLGIPANNNVEDLQIEKAVIIAFRELKAYMKTPVDKTVPYSTRIDLLKNGINTTRVLYVYPAKPKIGLNIANVDSSNVFALAASANSGGLLKSNSNGDLSPIVQQMALAQVSNTLSQDFQWKHDVVNQVVYCTCKQSRPSQVTVRYKPKYEDVSEIVSDTWIDYLIRLSEAHMKKALGRSRSKYKVEGSNVTLDGEILLQEAKEEFQTIREELKARKQKLVVLN